MYPVDVLLELLFLCMMLLSFLYIWVGTRTFFEDETSELVSLYTATIVLVPSAVVTRGFDLDRVRGGSIIPRTGAYSCFGGEGEGFS